MAPLTEPQVRSSFINVSKGEAGRLYVPRELDGMAWDDLDYVGWRDPRSPGKGYLAAPLGDRVVGVALRAPATGTGARKSMCSLCLTVHSGGVSLMVAPRAGRAGKDGNTVGTYVCSDLSCSLYVRGRITTDAPTLHETLTTEQRIDRLVANLDAFLHRVAGHGSATV